MPEISAALDAQHWLDQAAEILAFLRHNGCVVALDEDLWLFTGHAEDQLAAFLQQSAEVETLASGDRAGQ